jgi:hypothetical protein
MPYDFLSDEWLAEARRIRGEYKGLATPNANPVRINLVVTEVPERGKIDAHVDTSSGELDIEHGHLDGIDLTVTLDYETAKAMSAFMAGKIRVDGDMSKLLAMQGSGPVGETEELAARIREITK